MQELETISKMVLGKQGERPMLIVAWGRFLKMFHECYPESRQTQHAEDVCTCGHPKSSHMFFEDHDECNVCTDCEQYTRLLKREHITFSGTLRANDFCSCEVPDFAPFLECQNCGKPPRR